MALLKVLGDNNIPRIDESSWNIKDLEFHIHFNETYNNKEKDSARTNIFIFL